MMTFGRWIAFGMLALGVATCSFTGPAPNRNADIIVFGDSILAWHRRSERSIPSVVAPQVCALDSQCRGTVERINGEQRVDPRRAVFGAKWHPNAICF